MNFYDRDTATCILMKIIFINQPFTWVKKI
jgi:hypothetical protein